MIRRLGVVLAWVLATLIATTVALAAVQSVANQVVATPSSPLLAATTTRVDATSATSTASTTPPSSPSTTLDPLTREATSPAELGDGDVAVSSTAPDATTPTTRPPSSTTSTTSPPTSTTTTQPRTVAKSESYQLVGGWVRIAFTPDVVSLDGAGPNAGFSMEVEKSGPNQVEIEFSDGNHQSEFKAQWSGGELDVETSEDSEGND